MKTLEQIDDEIQLFSLKDPKQVTADDLIQVVNLLGNVVENMRALDASLARVSCELAEHLN